MQMTSLPPTPAHPLEGYRYDEATTLGLGAVARDLDRIYAVERSERADKESLRELYEERSLEHGKATTEVLEEVRERISGLDDKQRDRLELYMQESAPGFLDSLKQKAQAEEQAGGAPYLSWQKWLTEKANDVQLLNFLQWHVHAVVEQRKDPKVQAEIETIRSAYTQSVVRAIQKGWLSEAAKNAVTQVDYIEVHIGDVFDTLIQDRGGYHVRTTDYVVIGQGMGQQHSERVTSFARSAQRHQAHELNHAALGHLDGEPGQEQPGPYTWLDEALTEHIALALQYGDPLTMRPENRRDDDGTYEHERRLLDMLLSLGGNRIDPALATRAYSGTTAERHKFFDALNASWNADAIKAVTASYGKESLVLLDQGLSEREVRKRALSAVARRLMRNPREIFGEQWKPPSKIKRLGNRAVYYARYQLAA